MKYILFITAMILTFGLSAQSQKGKNKRAEKIEQQRVAFITTELDLNVEEAKQFWPMYNEYQNALNSLGRDYKNDKDIDEMSEEESRLALAEVMERKRSHIDLESEFMKNLETVIPAKKRLKLIRAEHEFKKSVLKRYKKRMKSGEKKDRKESREEKK